MNSPSTPFIAFPGKIHLIDSDRKLQSVVDQMKGIKEFGFDTETRPSFQKGQVFKVALLQLATDTDAFLIRLHSVTEFEEIKNIFEDTSVLKVGAAIRDDLKTLQKTFPFVPQNFIELQTVAKEKGLKNFGLKGMTEEVLNAPLSKGPKLTNWQATELTDQQLMYAATDAWIGLKIYRALNER